MKVRNRSVPLPAPALFLLFAGGCGGLEAYAWDPANFTVLAVFGIFLVLAVFVTFALSRGPDAPKKMREAVRLERNWLSELEELRNDYVVAQRLVIDRAQALMTETKRKDPEFIRLKIRSHQVMTKMLRLQEEMVHSGIDPDKVRPWDL